MDREMLSVLDKAIEDIFSMPEQELERALNDPKNDGIFSEISQIEEYLCEGGFQSLNFVASHSGSFSFYEKIFSANKEEYDVLSSEDMWKLVA